MYTRRTGFARYAPCFSRSDRSWRLVSRSCSKCRHVSPSTPGAAERLAMATFQMWPSAYSYSIGTPEQGSFAAEFLARPYLGRRFGAALTDVTARLEAGVGR